MIFSAAPSLQMMTNYVQGVLAESPEPKWHIVWWVLVFVAFNFLCALYLKWSIDQSFKKAQKEMKEYWNNKRDNAGL